MSKSKPSMGRPRPKQRNPPQGTIELFRSEAGDMYFSMPHGNEMVRWLVYPTGERWLKGHGYVCGMKITGGTANYMRTLDLIYTLKTDTRKQSKSQVRLAKLIRDTKRFDKKQAAERERFPALRAKSGSGSTSSS